MQGLHTHNNQEQQYANVSLLMRMSPMHSHDKVHLCSHSSLLQVLTQP